MKIVALLSALAAYTASVEAFFILTHPILEVTRLDPIINPGEVSSHMHTIIGGSNFDKTVDYASTQQGKCTTAPISIDKSSYWTPQLYSYSEGKYTMIPASYVNTYYLPRSKKLPVAFPEGLRMVSGDPYRRTFDPKNPDHQAISFVCLTGQSHSGDARYNQRNSFFEVPCDAMRMQVNFRQCGNGQLDSPDHKSHMAWASGGLDGGDCPDTHPIAYPELFYEFVYPVGQFPFNTTAGAINWVLANGDTTGYGFHGDFISGWPHDDGNGVNVLESAIQTCNGDTGLGIGGVLDDCPAFLPHINNAAAQACIPENPLVSENIGDHGPLDRLPGNNPLWVGTGPKPSFSDYTESAGFVDVQETLTTGWSDLGCFAEPKGSRALTAASTTSDSMTRNTCIAFCAGKGLQYAAVEYGRECYCDSQLRNGATLNATLDWYKCNMKCSASEYETCGGSATYELFNNPDLAPAAISTQLPSGWQDAGCRAEGAGGRALVGYATSGKNMTVKTCVETCAGRGYSIAGVEYGQECYCANSFSNGGGATASGCTMSCAGDVTRTCGGSSRLNVYSNNATILGAPAAASKKRSVALRV
ncbi:hypothetical protein HD553DRAFT_279680 [Filobasidium floriforme]|uniref:uncharacterized protein n=1 Tax=Filobasidium floriforme TaxID=5210 RepID=UPI001E8E3479|nr:uncharacterized protein HD553DRAFT_279680 [Filobasidium floriforme]KAH8090923.1 hypothetical protein HD553DRAFT_279680 [Filobasidium floriforme]